MPILAIAFVHAALLGATGLAVAPVIVHLLMRSRPRLVVFPALRFVRLTHNANVARHRLKHLLLLLMRMAAIAILATILARPKIESAAGLSGGSSDPVSAVIIIDTSGSMAYRVAGQPRLEDAKGLAVKLLRNLPGNSHTAVIWPDRPGDNVPLSTDTDLTIRQIQELSDRPPQSRDSTHESAAYRVGQAAHMVRLLVRAYHSLGSAPTARREIYIFNDVTRDSWDGVIANMFANEPDINVYLMDVSARENQDFLLQSAKWEAAIVSPRRSPVLTAEIHSGQLVGKRVVELEMDGQVVGRQEIDVPDKEAAVTAQFKIAPMPPGLHVGQVRLDGQDEINEDNVRHLTMEVGPLPQVLMIESGVAEGRAQWSVGDHVEAALAPPNRVSAGTALVDLVRVPAADFLIKPAADKARLDRAHAVVLADVSVLGDQQWDALKNYVGSGGTLITLMGPQSDPDAMSAPAASAVLPVGGLDKRMQLAEPRPASPIDFERNRSQVLATYRQHDKSPLVDRELVFQYYPLLANRAPPPNTQTLIQLSDAASSPLLLERRLGAGFSLLLTTCPQPDWTEWSQRATWPALAFSMVMTYNRGAQQAQQFMQDQPASVTVPAAFRAGTAAVTLPDNRGQQALPIDANKGALSVPTQLLGQYRVQLQSPTGEKQELAYAVNFDPIEYTLQKIKPDEIAVAFAPDRFLAVTDPADLQLGQARARASREEIGALMGLALLVLIIGESFFSNRFYRRPTATAIAAAAPTGRGQIAAAEVA